VWWLNLNSCLPMNLIFCRHESATYELHTAHICKHVMLHRMQMWGALTIHARLVASLALAALSAVVSTPSSHV
jgi:hypothetical protein